MAGDDESGSRTQAALRADRPAVQLDQLPHHRQPDPAALLSPAARILHPMKTFEEPGQLRGGYSHSGNRARSLRPSALPARSRISISPSKVNFRALETRFKTTFSHILPIHMDQFRKRRAIHYQLQPALSVATRKNAGQLKGGLGQIGSAQIPPPPFGFNPRKSPIKC